MPQVGRINVSPQELRAISQECQSCMSDLNTQLRNCFNSMDGLLADGWESESGDKLVMEFENMANANFDNYLAALGAYAQFCEDAIAAYEETEAARKSDVTAGRLQQLD